jgi:thymidine kinase
VVGKLTVITGPMASGKTLELIRLLSKREVRGANKILFKHEIDTRDGKNKSASRLGLFLEADMVRDSQELRKKYLDFKKKSDKKVVVGVEEAQFFDDGLYEEIISILDGEVDIFVTCPNQDFRGEPFGHREDRKLIPKLLSIADDLVFLTAVCTICGQDATKTQRMTKGKISPATEPLIKVGGNETYEPRCVECWIRPNE